MREPNRLLLFSTEFPPGPGGIGTHAWQVTSHLVELGWDVTVITPQDFASGEEIEVFNDAQPFPVVRLRPVRGAPVEALYRWRIATQWAQRWRPEVLLASGERAVWLTAWLARHLRLPWVAVGHGTEFGVHAGWKRRLTRWSFQQATAAVSVSQYTLRQIEAMSIRPRAARVIPNGADAGRFHAMPDVEVEAFRCGLGRNGDHLLLTVGNVTERKGQAVVIRALPRILEEVPNTHYLIVGLPTKEREFTSLAREMGVADHVHFLGRVDSNSLVRYLNGCDLFVMTSRYTRDGDFEGYGIAVVEAALCGKPSVVTADSGLAEAIVDGVTGYAVPQDDAGATAEAILTLLRDRDLRERMGRAARERAVSEQTWELRAREYDSLLRSVLTRSGGLITGTGPAAGASRLQT